MMDPTRTSPSRGFSTMAASVAAAALRRVGPGLLVISRAGGSHALLSKLVQGLDPGQARQVLVHDQAAHLGKDRLGKHFFGSFKGLDSKAVKLEGELQGRAQGRVVVDEDDQRSGGGLRAHGSQCDDFASSALIQLKGIRSPREW